MNLPAACDVKCLAGTVGPVDGQEIDKFDDITDRGQTA